MSGARTNLAAGLLPPLAPEAWRVIPWFAVGTLILFWIWTPLGWIGLAFTLWCATLFREPARRLPASGAAVVSPIDGQVSAVTISTPPAGLGLAPEERTCVTIVLGPWDSHVVRAPCGGRLARAAHGYGGRDGERLSLVIEDGAGTVAAVLIAEGLGRRVRSGAREGQTPALGERLAVILFAGRAEIYLPPAAASRVAVGQRVVAGETVLG